MVDQFAGARCLAPEQIGIAAPREFGPAVDAAGCKMPPAAMAGNFQIGVRLVGDLGHVAGNARQAAFLEREMRRAALRDPAMDHAAALAHRGGGVEIGDFAQALSAAHSRARACEEIEQGSRSDSGLYM